MDLDHQDEKNKKQISYSVFCVIHSVVKTNITDISEILEQK